MTTDDIDLDEPETWGAWGVRAYWAWHDAWVWRGFNFADIGIWLLVLGPFRVTLTRPVHLGIGDDDDEPDPGYTMVSAPLGALSVIA
jgi:hypothetical protein